MARASTDTAQLIGISYSPWTEKASWALDHHQIPYAYHEHLLLFGMPELRWRTGRWTGPLTVPAWVAPHRDPVLTDSWEIARYADTRGAGSKLFPEADLPRIEKYNRLSEKAADAARILVSMRLLRDPEAKAEVLPSFVPRFLRKAFSWLAQVGVAYLQREFGYRKDSEKIAERDIHDVWAELARDLQAAGGEHLIGGRLSYADIAMAVTLQCLEPVSSGRIRLGPAYRRCWATPPLQEEFRGLLAWRDGLYARYREARA